MLTAPILTAAETKILVLLSESVERFGVSRMRDFFDPVHCTLYHGLAINTDRTFVSVTLVEAGPSGGGPAVV